METPASYLNRKRQEISLLSSCLASPPEPLGLASVAAVIEHKFRLAAAIKAERSLQNWSVTETARLPAHRAKTGSFEFSYGYQRADLRVRAPAIYPAVGPPTWRVFAETIYTNSGMSAMAAVLTALSRLSETAELLTPRGCYSETRELAESFAPRLRIVPAEALYAHRPLTHGITRVALLDSSVHDGFFELVDRPPDAIGLVIFDTTCFWRSSARIERVVKWTRHLNLPLVLVRSHSKLDCLGVEYARLGSAVITAPQSTPLVWTSELAGLTNDSVRLFGAAPTLSSFPPFAHVPQFQRCSRMRIAAIMRNNRRMARLIAAELGGAHVCAFQHGLYMTLMPERELSVLGAKELAAALTDEIASSNLPVSHAGSFGFDFVAIEWFADTSSQRNVIRVAASDIPSSVSDEIARRIAYFWGRRESSTRSSRRRSKPSALVA